jgi:hypothetical protein
MNESAFSSSWEDIVLEDSSSSPTGSEDLLDPKFLTPIHQKSESISNSKFQLESRKEFIFQQPLSYGLLCLPNGNIIEYEIPKCTKVNKGIKRLDSMFTNFASLVQRDDKESRSSTLKRNASDFKDKSGSYSRNYNKNGFLWSIKEDHVRENSSSSLLMNKPIRSLRDVYMGIRKDYKERNKRINKKNDDHKEETKEDLKESSVTSEESYDSYNDDEDVEMDAEQKKILEDKVIKIITHWNDMNYIKSNNNIFWTPEKDSIEEAKETPKEPKTITQEPLNLPDAVPKDPKATRIRKIRQGARSKKKHFLASESKSFKQPSIPTENRQQNIILFNHSQLETQGNTASEKIFLFTDTKRERPLRKITFNEKMRKMKMLSESQAYYQASSQPKEKLPDRKIIVNKTFMLEKRKLTQEKKLRFNKAYSDSKTSLSPSASMIYKNTFYKSNYANLRHGNSREFINSYSSNWRNEEIKRRKLRSREGRNIRMKISKINVSSQPKIANKLGARIVGKRKELHNIKIKKTKNDLHSIMTIKNSQINMRRNKI